jgi:hypothetical protein
MTHMAKLSLTGMRTYSYIVETMKLYPDLRFYVFISLNNTMSVVAIYLKCTNQNYYSCYKYILWYLQGTKDLD